jgi:hypothetical protein
MGSVLAGQVDEAAGQLPVWIDKLNACTQAHFDTTVVPASSAAQSGQATQHVTQYLQEHAGDLLGAVGSLGDPGQLGCVARWIQRRPYGSEAPIHSCSSRAKSPFWVVRISCTNDLAHCSQQDLAAS